MGRGIFGFLGNTTPILMIALFGGGTYLAWVNRFPPFDEGGLVDKLLNYLPKHTGKGATPASEDGGDGSVADDLGGGGGGSGNATDPSQGDFIAPGAGPTVPPIGFGPGPTGGPMGMQFPSSNMQSGIMQTSRASDPTSGEFNVYQNYAKGLQMLYGQGNTANLGPGGGGLPNVVGDPNLGTTPVPQSLFQQQGYPPNGQGGYPYPQQMQQQPFGHPSMPPGTPFLPNPSQYPGPVQPGPYPAVPPVMSPPPPWAFGLPPQLIPGPDIFVVIPGRKGIPFIRGIPDLLSLDVGGIHIGLDGIRIGDLIRIGGGWHNIFPHGVDPYDQTKFKKDISNFVNKMLRKIKGKNSKDRLNIFKQIVTSSGGGSGGINIGGSGGINIGGSGAGGINIGGSGGGLGGLFGGSAGAGVGGLPGNIFGGSGGSSSSSGGLGGLLGGLQGGAGAGGLLGGMGGMGAGNMNMIPGVGSMGNIPNIPGMSNMFPGGLFQSNAGFVLPNKAAYMQYNGRNSLQPLLKRKNSAGRDDSFFFKIGNNR